MSYPVARHQLDNGLKIVVSEEPDFPAVVVHMLYAAGTRHDPPGMAGLSRLAARLAAGKDTGTLADGHPRLTGDPATESVSVPGADYTAFRCRMSCGLLSLALRREACRMRFAATRGGLDTQREHLLPAAGRDAAGLPGSEEDRLHALVYPSAHPYRHAAGCPPRDLRKITLQDVNAFRDTWYLPANAVLAVTGGVTAGEAFAAAEQNFAHLHGTAPATGPVPVLGPGAVQGRDDVIAADGGTAVALGFRLPPAAPGDPSFTACDIALRILADRADTALRGSIGVTETAGYSTDARAGDSIGILRAATTAGGEAPFLLETVLAQAVRDLAAQPPGEAETARAASAAAQLTASAVASCTGRAARLARLAADGGNPELINTAAAQALSVTPAQVREAAATWLRPGSAAVVTTRPARRPQEALPW